MRPKAPKHKRIKPKWSDKATRAEKAHMARVAEKGCLVCQRPASIHHDKIRGKRDHMNVVPLCRFHHQDQKHGWHGFGSNKAFENRYGIDIRQEAADFRLETEMGAI